MIFSRYHRSFGVAEVPLCVGGTILVKIHARTIDQTNWDRIAPAHVNSHGGFIGTVEAVANDFAGESVVKVGDVVAGVNGECVDILIGSFQEYMNVRPGDLWPISATNAKNFGIPSLSRDSGCAIM